MTSLRIELAGNLEPVSNLVARDGGGRVFVILAVYFTKIKATRLQSALDAANIVGGSQRADGAKANEKKAKNESFHHLRIGCRQAGGGKRRAVDIALLSGIQMTDILDQTCKGAW